MLAHSLEQEELPPYMDAEAHYATRNNALTPTVVWKVRGDRLRREDGKGPPREVALGDVQVVQLEYAPTRPEKNRHRCRITLHHATRLELFNRTYRGAYDFEDTSAAYVEFVRALHVALAKHSPECRFVAGASTVSYALNVSVLVLLVAALLGGLSFFVAAGMLWVVLAKILLIVLFLPLAIRWVQRNKPRVYRPDAIPAHVLPQ